MEQPNPEVYASCDSPFACAAAPIISRKWVPVIVCHLLHGRKRYSELGKVIPYLSGKVLAENLLFMEQERILRREVRDAQPVEVWYQLTNKGKDLASVIQAMNRWGQRWLRSPGSSVIRGEASRLQDVSWLGNPDILP